MLGGVLDKKILDISNETITPYKIYCRIRTLVNFMRVWLEEQPTEGIVDNELNGDYLETRYLAKGSNGIAFLMEFKRSKYVAKIEFEQLQIVEGSRYLEDHDEWDEIKTTYLDNIQDEFFKMKMIDSPFVCKAYYLFTFNNNTNKTLIIFKSNYGEGEEQPGMISMFLRNFGIGLGDDKLVDPNTGTEFSNIDLAESDEVGSFRQISHCDDIDGRHGTYVPFFGGIVMEFIDMSFVDYLVILNDTVEDNDRKAIQLIIILTGYIQGLNAINEAGFIHGDIHPGNIMIKRAYDGQYTPKIIDLGIMMSIDDDWSPGNGVVQSHANTAISSEMTKLKALDAGRYRERFEAIRFKFDLSSLVKIFIDKCSDILNTAELQKNLGFAMNPNIDDRIDNDDLLIDMRIYSHFDLL